MDPLLEGLASLGISSGRLLLSDPASILESSCRYLVIHAADGPVIDAAQAIKRRTGCEVICFTSDLYQLAWPRELASFVDYFIAPTTYHAQILGPAVWQPVFVVPECIDPIAIPGAAPTLPVEANQRVLWFGYPESFSKALGFLLPQAFTESGFAMDDFLIITAEDRQVMADAEHLPFAPQTFYRLSARCGYSMLSHFVFDSHINSYIKSPNKLVTSLIRGHVPWVSDTPNYRDLMHHYELSPFIYRNGPDLVRLLKHRDIQRDRDAIPFDRIQQDLRARYSSTAVAAIFASHFVGRRPRHRLESANRDRLCPTPDPHPWAPSGDHAAITRLEGAIESINGQYLLGWARGTEESSAAEIIVTVDGYCVGRGVTDIFRPDLNGRFGFVVALESAVDPATILTGQTLVVAQAAGCVPTELGAIDSLHSEILAAWARRLVTDGAVDELQQLLRQFTA